jgi:hypothetical protein
MSNYYLFLYQKEDLAEYKRKFDEVYKSIEEGKTPVFNEMRAAKTSLIETFPYQSLNAILIVVCSIILSTFQINELVKIGVVLVVNDLCKAVSNYIFTVIKHNLRISLCKRLGIEANERNIAVMESLEYQSV